MPLDPLTNAFTVTDSKENKTFAGTFELRCYME